MYGPIPAYAGEPRRDPGSSAERGAYPRIRGGTFDIVNTSRHRRGLSPHTRGNPGDGGLAVAQLGPIPAYAGEPSSMSTCHSTRRAYPRIRGGTGRSTISVLYRSGLSPHTRGNPNDPKTGDFRAGPIPAYAGEPARQATVPLGQRAYPRIRGGTKTTLANTSSGSGLSPHTRGNPRQPVHRARPAGPIPAYAGEPEDGVSLPPKNRAYPRIRGGTRTLRRTGLIL